MPLDVIYTKSTSIWDDILPFVEKLTASYKQSQETKWNNEWQLSAIADIEKANKPQQVVDFIGLQKIPEENLDMAGFTKFAKDSVNLLTMKEIQMNPEDFAKTGVQVAKTPQVKTVPDKKEWGELYKFVSELPTGKVDWTNTMGLFKQKLESGRAIGSAGQQFLSMIMGQSMPVNQRQKVQQDFEFTKDIKETLYPEMVEDKPNTELEYWLREHPGAGVEDYWNAKAGKEKTFDFESFLKDEPDWEIGSISSTGTVTVRRKDTKKKYDFKTWEEAQNWINQHKQSGYQWKIDPQPEGFNVSAEKVPVTPKGGTTKLVPTYQTINTINEDLLNPGLDRKTTLHNASLKYDLTDARLASAADQAKRAYDMFEGIILEEDKEAIDDEGMVTDPEKYTDFYKDYEKFSEIYFKETGQILPKKYLSIEEAGVYTTNQWALGKAKGGEKPVRNEDGIPWSWQKETDVTQELFNEMQRTGLKPEDYDLERLAKEQGIDLKRLMQMFNAL